MTTCTCGRRARPTCWSATCSRRSRRCRTPDGSTWRSYLAGNHLFFLNLAMAAAKSAAMWAEQVEGSSIVTMMCRNGTSYGIRLAGSTEVFISAAPAVEEAMYYPDYGPRRARATSGTARSSSWWGSAVRLLRARRRSPASCGRDGRRGRDDRADGVHLRRREHPVQAAHLELPGNPGRGRRAAGRRAGHDPKVTTGILHASSGVGQIGAGVATAPVECFRAASAGPGIRASGG